MIKLDFENIGDGWWRIIETNERGDVIGYIDLGHESNRRLGGPENLRGESYQIIDDEGNITFHWCNILRSVRDSRKEGDLDRNQAIQWMLLLGCNT